MTNPEPNWVVLARIVRPQGRTGEVLADILTDFPESFAERTKLYLQPQLGGTPAAAREATLDAHWLHKGRVVLKFAGIDSITAADQLRGFNVVIPSSERRVLEDDSVYVSDLLQAHVFDLSRGGAQDAGEIVDILPEGLGPAMLVVQAGVGEPVLIPFVKAYLKKIDLQAKRVEMDLPEGLLAMQAPLTAEEWQRMREETRTEARGKE